MLTRALFESWDVSGTRELSIADLEAGIKAMQADDVEEGPVSCAIIAVAKKIARELSMDGGKISLYEFEKRIANEVADIEQSVVRQNPDDMLGG